MALVQQDELVESVHLRLQRTVSGLGVVAVLSPLWASLLVRWVMGRSGLSLGANLALALVLGVLVSPLAVLGWRAFYRPQLVTAPEVLQAFVGKRLAQELPRREIRSIEVRATRFARFAVAQMQSGEVNLLIPPIDLRVPLLGDRNFDQRIAQLEEWRQRTHDPRNA